MILIWGVNKFRFFFTRNVNKQIIIVITGIIIVIIIILMIFIMILFHFQERLGWPAQHTLQAVQPFGKGT